MKQLLILRHADAKHTSPTGRDEDRNLSSRGRRQCQHMAAWLKEHGIAPQQTLCSPARRTRETLHELPSESKPTENTQYPRELYTGGTHAFIELVSQLPPEIDVALIVGHNPTLSDAVSDFVHAPIALDTCMLAILELETDNWALTPVCPIRLVDRVEATRAATE